MVTLTQKAEVINHILVTVTQKAEVVNHILVTVTQQAEVVNHKIAVTGTVVTAALRTTYLYRDACPQGAGRGGLRVC